MDLDSPVQSIDPQADARRVASARAARRRSAVDLLVALAIPLVALGGGFLLGGWHADAPIVGAVGMVFAYGAAHGAGTVAGLLALLVEAPRLLRRLRTPGEQGKRTRTPVAGSASRLLVAAFSATTFAACAALTGFAAGLLGGGGPYAVDVIAFGTLGAVLGLALAFSDAT